MKDFVITFPPKTYKNKFFPHHFLVLTNGNVHTPSKFMHAPSQFCFWFHLKNFILMEIIFLLKISIIIFLFNRRRTLIIFPPNTHKGCKIFFSSLRGTHYHSIAPSLQQIPYKVPSYTKALPPSLAL